MESYNLTEKFTLIPKHLYRQEYFEEMFTIGKNETVKSIELEKYNAILAFAVKKDAKEGTLPLVYKLIELSVTLQEHNKITVSYLPSKKMTCIVAMEGEKLLLANSYRTPDEKSMLYFLTLVAQQVMFNPLHTRITSFGAMEQMHINLIEEYFCSVTVINS